MQTTHECKVVDWKVSRKMTINFGLRYDYNAPPGEKYDRMNRGFDATVKSPIASQISPAMLALYPNLANLSGGLKFAGKSDQA